MKISVDDQELFTLSDIQCQVIQNDVPSDIFDSDMKRRIQWILMERYNVSLASLKDEWMSKLSSRMDSIPTDPDKFAALVFSQPDYMCRSARDVQDKNLGVAK